MMKKYKMKMFRPYMWTSGVYTFSFANEKRRVIVGLRTNGKYKISTLPFVQSEFSKYVHFSDCVTFKAYEKI